MKKELAIIFPSTGNMTFAMANAMLGIKKHSPDLKADIIIFEQGIYEKDKKILNQIMPCKFIEYIFPIKDTSNFDQVRFNRFTQMTFSRYECFKLLDEYKKVMWMDTDILIQGDITPMLNYGDKTGIAFAPEPYPLWSLFTDKVWGNYDTDVNFFNAGIFIISNKLPNYTKITDWCYEATKEYAPILHLQDQAILNLMFQEFNLEIESMDKKYNRYPTDKLAKKSTILHAYSSEKFWNFWNFREWNQNYNQWLKMGGSKYEGKKANFISREVKKIFPNAPDIVRKPKAFVKYFIEEYKRKKQYVN